jgi:alkanesulfonate monooxygenase SsuD/methylene tetrahydromethanopterin reductase-like flavin-dependent oxidoreductase (luciferase family)
LRSGALHDFLPLNRLSVAAYTKSFRQEPARGLIPGVGWRAAEIMSVAREAEEAGFHAIFTAEVNNDALATAQLTV